MNHDKQPTSQHVENNDLTPEQNWQPFVFLVILILAGIGGMAVLYYKLEYPVWTGMLQDRVVTTISEGRTPDLGDKVMRPSIFDLGGVSRSPQSVR
jgi:hypothetical protein